LENINEKARKHEKTVLASVCRRGNYTVLARVCESLFRFTWFFSGLSRLMV
jgi:hypothetical protein